MTMPLLEDVNQHLGAEKGGVVIVRNLGAFVARFSITYNLGDTEFSNDSGNITLGVNRSLRIPTGATSIEVKIEEHWGFGWSTIHAETLTTPQDKGFKLTGTTLNPHCEEMEFEELV